jgi:hypothetical protein
MSKNGIEISLDCPFKLAIRNERMWRCCSWIISKSPRAALCAFKIKMIIQAVLEPKHKNFEGPLK